MPVNLYLGPGQVVAQDRWPLNSDGLYHRFHCMHKGRTHQQLEDSNASGSVPVFLLQISSLDERVALVHHFLSTPAQQCMQEHSYHA